MIPREDWLHLAKRLTIGSSKRVYHAQECRPNLVVANRGDRYTCYCHRCHEGGVVLKEHAVLEVAPQKRVMPWPADAVHISKLDNYQRLNVARFLATKGMDFETMLYDEYMWYSALTRRILFGTRAGWLGRTDINAEPKWCNYAHPTPSYAEHPLQIAQPVVVLTEDYLSALKIRWAVPNVEPIALLGTRISKELLLILIKQKPTAVLGFFDGDKAGDEADKAISKRLRGLGLNYVSINRDVGCDPKDLSAKELQLKINEVLK